MKGAPARPRLMLVVALAAYAAIVVWVIFRAIEPPGPERITVRLAHWQNEVGPADGLDAVIRRYEELNPGVRVKQMVIPPSVYRQWLRTNFVGENAADVVEYGSWLQGMSDVPARYFAPITAELMAPNPYNRGTPLEGVPWLKTFSDELLEQRMNSPELGQYYAITLARSSFRVFSNRELLREVTGSERAPRTLIELRAVAAQLAAFREARGRPIMLFAGSRETASILMGMYLMGSTSALVRDLDRDGLLSLYPHQMLGSYLRGEWSFRHPALRSGLALLAEFDAQMKPGYQQLSGDESRREFLRGEALFIFSGTWMATTMRQQADFTVDALRLPQPTRDDPVVGSHILGPFADGNDMTTFGFYLNKRSPQRAAAIDFMRFLASHEGNALFSRRSGWPPSIREVPMDPALAAFISDADGYTLGASYLGSGGNSRALLLRNLHLLSGPRGSPESLAQALDEQMPAAARADLEALVRDAWLAALPQDVRIAAAGVLAGGGPGRAEAAQLRERWEVAQNLAEGRALQMTRQLQDAVVATTD